MGYISGQEIMLKMFLQKKSLKINPVQIFLSDSGATGMSHLVKTIYQVVSKELLYHSKEPDQPLVLLLSPAGISAVNIGGTSIHSGLGIKPGAKLLSLSDRMKASLRNELCFKKWFQMICFSKSILGYLRFLCAPLLTVVLVADLPHFSPVMVSQYISLLIAVTH